MKYRFSMFLVVVLGCLLIYGCAAVKKAASEITSADVQSQAAQIQNTVTPFTPAPLQPFVPMVSGVLGYVVCLIRQMYKDHMAEKAALKAELDKVK